MHAVSLAVPACNCLPSHDAGQCRGRGVSIGGIYVGLLGHADDLRSVTPSLLSLEKQVDIIQSFTQANCLTLNLEKLELLAMSKAQKPPECTLSLQECEIIILSYSYMPGAVWSYHFSPQAAIESNFNKARRAFFGLDCMENRTHSLPVKQIEFVSCQFASMAVKVAANWPSITKARIIPS